MNRPSDRTNGRRTALAAVARAVFRTGALGAVLAAGLLFSSPEPGLAAAPPGGETASAITGVPTISVSEVRRGQQGYGLSVFAGSEPERFEVEVLGVMRYPSPDTSYILARLSGQGLERSGVIAGMSGSPVYLEGRLAGAVAFSWAFSHDAIAGITPIEGMRRLNELPRMEPSTAGAGGGRALDHLLGLVEWEPADGALEQALGQLRPTLANGALGAIQWSASGFGGETFEVLRRGLGAVAPAGAGGAGAVALGSGAAALGSRRGEEAEGAEDAELTAGSAVSAVLIDGDLRLGATGTVTERDGENILAFGHPFLGLGPIRLPMAAAEVVTVISNQANSFKIANLGRRVGAFEEDRLLGIQGRLGAEAPMLPMRLVVRNPAGEIDREFNMEVAALPQLTPVLVAIATLGGLDAASYTGGRQGLDLVARFGLDGYGEVALDQSFDGGTAAFDAVTYLLSFATFLTQNTFEKVTFEGVEIEITQAFEPRTMALVGAHAERTVVRPGASLRIHLDLAPYRGDAMRRTVEIVLPAEVPDGRYHLLVGDGASVDVARLRLEKPQPVSFPQALRLLRSYHSRRELLVIGFFGGPGLAVAGETLPRLPGSVRSIWSAASSGSATPLSFAVAQQHVEPLDAPLDGIVRIDLEIRRREPPTPATPAETSLDSTTLAAPAAESPTDPGAPSP